MKKSEFFYELPPEMIAQTPIEPRDASRLMVLDRRDESITHKHFYDICSFLRPGDCLVVNDSRVMPARLMGKKDTGANVEILLLNQRKKDVWEALAGPGKRAKTGAILSFGDGIIKGEIVDVLPDGNRLIKFEYEGSFFEILDKIGEMPLPHYITEKLEDKERYQTVYSHEIGSAAAPTAGLHFTTELMDKVRAMGVNIAYVTLHVGLGTFRPVKEEEITDHKMHSEHFYLPQETIDIIKKTKENGGRVISVGTTATRTLESAYDYNGNAERSEGWTDIFIYPGYKFKVIDALITNFHLPESSLIMLVSAFAGYDYTMRAYNTAVQEKYRFFSFGDAMMIL
ncbi:MAG: tRNA preQ1(34) S-adenosylmethionine ribosyltransferase-isomerase QueA [Clostridia bacterium]|nr:tRNA preQ1(34) S-adenosylmethionine ribosyltransferase-isomerase QueA [Clostridia bacterium]